MHVPYSRTCPPGRKSSGREDEQTSRADDARHGPWYPQDEVASSGTQWLHATRYSNQGRIRIAGDCHLWTRLRRKPSGGNVLPAARPERSITGTYCAVLAGRRGHGCRFCADAHSCGAPRRGGAAVDASVDVDRRRRSRTCRSGCSDRRGHGESTYLLTAWSDELSTFRRAQLSCWEGSSGARPRRKPARTASTVHPATSRSTARTTSAG